MLTHFLNQTFCFLQNGKYQIYGVILKLGFFFESHKLKSKKVVPFLTRKLSGKIAFNFYYFSAYTFLNLNFVVSKILNYKNTIQGDS